MEELWTKYLPNLLYDLVKVGVGYLVARLLYERLYKGWRHGGWILIVKKGHEELTRRQLSATLAERVLTNENDLSIYVKGVVSFYEMLNMDICSPEAYRTGLMIKDRKQRTLTVDLSKNPPNKQREQQEQSV